MLKFFCQKEEQKMDMEIITSAASATLANIVLAVIALVGAYAVYCIRLVAAKAKAQTKPGSCWRTPSTTS